MKMAVTNGRQAIVDQRRALVGQATLRKATQREIVALLANEGIVNPDTTRPYTLGTINADIKALREQWRMDASADISIFIAEHLAELREIRRAAWKTKELQVVLRALKQEAELIGLDAPLKVDWRMELENAGINPSEVFNEIVAKYVDVIESGGKSDT